MLYRVGKAANAINIDMDLVCNRQGEIVRRDNARARKEHDAMRKRCFLAKP